MDIAQTDAVIAKPGRARRLLAWLQGNPIFIITVLVPTLIAIAYYGVFASDIYISESRFVIRSPQKPSSGGMFGDILQSTGIARAQDDTYSVRDFIMSRDALRELEEKLEIRKDFSNPSIDLLDRFPGISLWDKSFEEFYKYYGKHVSIDFDPVSSITTLTVRAYAAEDAKRINDQLLQMSERLVNALNDRSRHDLIRFAEQDVRDAAEMAKEASTAMLTFRKSHSVYEPDKQATIQLSGIAKIREELISTEAEIAQFRKLSPSNPQIGALETRAESLRNAIATEAAKVTDGRGSFSANASTFERLTLDSTIADKQLGATLAALETARSDANRKQLYLERLVQANAPDKAMEPKRIRSIASTLFFGMILWAVARLVVASIREHGGYVN